MTFLYRVGLFVFGVVGLDSNFEDIFYVLDCWLHVYQSVFVCIDYVQ